MSATMNPDLIQRLQGLLDEHDVRQVLLRYCRGVDRCDQALIQSCFHSDAVDDHGGWVADGSRLARHIVDLVRPGLATAMHFLGNVLIEVAGEEAFAESYLLAYRDYEDGGKAYTRTRALRFVDRFERREGQWRISERVVVDGWSRVDEVASRQEGSEAFRFGRKDRDDPVYAIRTQRIAREPTLRRPDGTSASSWP